jgi:hypothetical protein
MQLRWISDSKRVKSKRPGFTKCYICELHNQQYSKTHFIQHTQIYHDHNVIFVQIGIWGISSPGLKKNDSCTHIDTLCTILHFKLFHRHKNTVV